MGTGVYCYFNMFILHIIYSFCYFVSHIDIISCVNELQLCVGNVF